MVALTSSTPHTNSCPHPLEASDRSCKKNPNASNEPFGNG